MDTYENKLIRSVILKDREKTKEYSKLIFQNITETSVSFDYFKTYLAQFNGIFYWNLIKNIQDEEYFEEILNKRNYFSQQIVKAQNISELELNFSKMLDYYTASQNNIIFNCKNPLIKNILIYIYNNSNEKITLELLSTKFHISKSYLSNLISSNVGISLPMIILEFRMEKAVNLLLETNYSINEISLLSGFDSTSYFCHQFKNKFKLTPKQFRNENNREI